MNIPLIIIEGNYGVIDSGDSTCHSYYIIRFSSCPYTLQVELIIYGQVVSSGKMVCEETCYFPININSRYCVSPKNKYNNTIVSLIKEINGNMNIILHDSKDFVPSSLR